MIPLALLVQSISRYNFWQVRGILQEFESGIPQSNHHGHQRCSNKFRNIFQEEHDGAFSTTDRQRIITTPSTTNPGAFVISSGSYAVLGQTDDSDTGNTSKSVSSSARNPPRKKVTGLGAPAYLENFRSLYHGCEIQSVNVYRSIYPTNYNLDVLQTAVK